MVQKLKDAASILKAKLKQDELQEALVQATSEENWQASTTVLHEISNAAYNYEKWQRISQYIWDKLKKKNSWRKILKTLNLVDFLIRNGPPNTINTFKYQLYQFKTFENFTHYSDGSDRGEPIREKSKTIVQLLSNQEMLEQERVKAKTIRERMSGMSGVGGFTAGYGGSDSKYEGYNSKNYGKNNTSGATSITGGNISGVGETAYGNYSDHQSTLSKYKDKNAKPKASTTTNSKVPDITGYGTTTTQATTQQAQKSIVQDRKPFEKQAPKLRKPGTQAASIVPTPKVEQATNITPQTKNQGSILDDDILGFSEPAKQPQTQQQQSQQTQQQPQNKNVTDYTGSLINPMYGTTAQMAANNVQQQNTNNSQQQNNQNTVPQQTQQASSQGFSFDQVSQGYNQQPQHNQQNNQYNQQQQYNQQNNQYNQQQQYNQQPQYNQQQQPQYNQQQHQQQQAQYNQQQQQQSHGFINPMYGTTAPMAAQQNQQNNGGHYQNTGQTSQQNSQQNSQPNAQQQQSNSNVKWLSTEEKGLIDFSDFGTQVNKKKQTDNLGFPEPSQDKGNNIKIDTWNW